MAKVVKKKSQRSKWPQKKGMAVLEELLLLIRISRRTIKGLNEKVSEAQQELVEGMQALSQEKIKVTDEDGVDVTATLVESSSSVLDEAGLRKDLTPKQWDYIKVEKADHNKIEDAVQRGIIDAKVVAKHTTEQPRAPYVRITERGGKEE